jgi:hypothetical protein
LWILKIFSPEQFFIAKREKNHPRRIMIMNMKRIIVVWSMLLMLALTLLAGCAGSSGSSPNTNAPLSAGNINLIFVVSPDLLYNTPGDIQPDTANLTSQGLNRSLQMATYLKQQVLGSNNVTAIYALAPMTHLQTAKNYPDMAAIWFIQQFALLNQVTIYDDPTKDPYTANCFPINVSYAEGSVPEGVAIPTDPVTLASPSYCPGCTGLDFNNKKRNVNDTLGNNDTLVARIIDKKTPGYYVFSAPWETTKDLLAEINTRYGNKLNIPTTYLGSNFVYAISISIPPPGSASLVTYNSNLNPPASYPYPVLPAPVASAACTNKFQPYFSTVLPYVTSAGAANISSTIYIVRHAEAHPDPLYGFDDGNYVAAGQWRALSLAIALKGKISPDKVYSIDPAGIWYPNYNFSVSYIRTSLTVLPYAIANNLPFYLAAGISSGSAFNLTDATVAQNTSNFFFTGHTFSNQTLLVAWESGHIKPFLNALLSSYGVASGNLLDPVWPSADYDTIWTVILDGYGNLTVHNAFCEGIDSTSLPATAPQF